MITCQICNIEIKSIRSLSKHIRDKHNCKSKDYYDMYLLKTPAKCKICNAPVEFQNITKGYLETCSHSCGCKLSRMRLAQDEDREVVFRNKIAKSMSNIWKSREETGNAKLIREKIGKTISLRNANLTSDERSDKFGWLKKLSPEEKEHWIKNVMLNTGAHVWWESASEEQKKEIFLRRAASLIGVSLEEYSAKTKTEQDLYYASVRRHTEISYSMYQTTIDPSSLRGKGFHLDHKYSIICGFYDNVPPEVIGSKANLEIISDSANMLKGRNCSISKEKLLECYYAEIQQR